MTSYADTDHNYYGNSGTGPDWDEPDEPSGFDVVLELVENGVGELRERYSGRGMYGATCVGIVTAKPDYCIEEATMRGLRGAKVDGMGLAHIVYWPDVTAPQDGDQ